MHSENRPGMSTRVTKSRNQTWLVIQLNFVEIPPTTDGTRFKMLEFIIDQTEELYLSMALLNRAYHAGRTRGIIMDWSK
jgi:hypothetical protein